MHYPTLDIDLEMKAIFELPKSLTLQSVFASVYIYCSFKCCWLVYALCFLIHVDPTPSWIRHFSNNTRMGFFTLAWQSRNFKDGTDWNWQSGWTRPSNWWIRFGSTSLHQMHYQWDIADASSSPFTFASPFIRRVQSSRISSSAWNNPISECMGDTSWP